MTSKEEEPTRIKPADRPDIGGLTSLTTTAKEATLKSNENRGLSNSNDEEFKVQLAGRAKEKENSLYNLEWPLVVSETKQEKPETSGKHEIGSHRFHIALLGLTIAAVNCYAQATFCIAIVEMVLPSDFLIKNNETTQSVVIRVIPQLNGAATSVSIDVPDNPILFEDNSCPVEYKYRNYYDSWRFLSNENKSEPVSTIAQSNTNLIDMSDRFDWDASRQGLLLGAFAIGTAPLQVLGGRLAEIYGAKWVLLAGCIGTALTNLTIPLIARFSFILLLINRVSMGIAQAGMEPGLMCLLAEWLTPAETGFFISMLLFAICIGFFLGSLCSSFILTIGYGWPLTYYVAGGLNLIAGLVWLVYASSRPSESSLITAKELAYIEGSKQEVIANNNNSKQLDENNDLNSNISPSPSPAVAALADKPNAAINNNNNKVDHEQQVVKHPVIGTEQAPWMNILRTPSVWAFIICKISIRWSADVLGIELPSYLANVLHLSIKLNGILNSVSSALFAIFSFLTGYLANEILRNQVKANSKQYHNVARETTSYFKTTISKTNLRKTIQSGASFGSAICMCLMTRYDCNILFSMSMLLVLSCCLVMGTGGELQIPYDMTSKYPGTVHGLACTMSVSGWLAPPLIGLILGDQPSSRYRWNIVWYLTASINLIGGLVFVLFADASPRDFDRRPTRKVGSRNSSSNKEEKEEQRASSLEAKNEQYATDVERGRHANLDGYYNAACRSSADGSPITVERCLHEATCDAGSPATLPYLTVELGADGCLANELQHQQQRQQQLQQEPNWESYFDRDLIKCRQVEESFIARPAVGQSGYLHHQLDSLASQPIIFPYRAKSSTTGEHLPPTNANQRAIASLTNYKEAAIEPPGRQKGLVWRLVRQIGGQSRKKFSLGERKRVVGPQTDKAISALSEDKWPHENQRADVLPHKNNLVERDSNQQLVGATFARGTNRITKPTTAKTITHL